MRDRATTSKFRFTLKSALLLGLALSVAGAGAWSALAAPPASKQYSAVFEPGGGGAAGSVVTRTLVITNKTTVNEPDFGWVHVMVPAGFTVDDSPLVPPQGKSWTLTATPDGFILSANSSQDRLAGDESIGGESIKVKVTGTLPCAGSADFVTDTAQANQGKSGGNRWLLQGSQPSIPVDGSCKLAITDVNGGDSPVFNTAFSVTVVLKSGDGQTIPAPTAVEVELDATGPGTLDGTPPGTTPTGTIPQGGSQVKISGVTYSVPANDVVLTASAPGTAIASDSLTIDVLKAFTRVVGLIAGEAPPTPPGTCDDTVPAPPGPDVCVRVELPNGAAGTTAVISIAVCTGVPGAQGCNGDSLAEFLADLGTLYSPADPARIIIEYDRSLRVSTKDTVFVEPTGSTEFVESLPCRDDPLDLNTFFCTDSVHGDGQGDRVFELAFWKDIRLGSK